MKTELNAESNDVSHLLVAQEENVEKPGGCYQPHAVLDV